MGNLDKKEYHFVKPLVKAIAQALGSNCEVVLHDLYDIEHSIVAIENGHITGREVGDSVTNLGLEVLRNGAEEGDTLNYTNSTKDGKVLRCSSIYIRDEDGIAIGSICINYNISDFMLVSKIINNFVDTNKKVDETFSGDINEVIENLLEKASNHVGKTVPFMNKDDKLAVLEYLDQKGMFTVKRSIERVALYLDVSKFTIYNYLEEIRVKKESTIP
ncbi:transcriptional regulator [Salicibibacter cibi]|uniref:Transcriptional regulator n=1 Tax=Salicibibacter cibi TaxID=2743001 RepID=A0A7T7CEA6_9BACI|nr:helix-turn-helix transcriptional regulator [Salicibibacter cibi]QQK78858.1 transcriptional regulator [Salicibibacter cibi]